MGELRGDQDPLLRRHRPPQHLEAFALRRGAGLLYNDYLTHGKIWYAVVKSQKYGYVVGVTRNCVVTVFSRTELPEFKRYVKSEILPLIG